MLLTSRGGRLCTATHLRRDLVLTAAHCVRGEYPQNLRVSAGSMRAAIAARWVWIHPRYRGEDGKGPSSYDVALVSLYDGPRELEPHQLAHRGLRLGEDVRFVGFGDSRIHRAGEPAFARQGFDTYMPGRSASASGVEDRVAATERTLGLLYFEAGPTDLEGSRFGSAVTQGDSGGPLFDSAGRLSGVIVAVSQVDRARHPHRVTWAVDLSYPPVRIFLMRVLKQSATRPLA